SAFGVRRDTGPFPGPALTPGRAPTPAPSDPRIQPHPRPPVVDGDGLAGVEGPEVDEVPGDQQGQDARCRGAGDAAGVGGAGRADEGAQEHGDGEAEEGDEDDGVEVEDGPFLVEEPGEVAGRDAAGDGARAPVAAEEPAPQDVEDGEAAHPPQ